MEATGVLLINLGTPNAPVTAEVRDYLAEFLGDSRVLDMPAPVRKLLLNLVILPFRPRKSAAAYREIWTEGGSPLRCHSDDLLARVREALGPEVPVEFAMRYGTPSIESALHVLRRQGVNRLVVLPLYPQQASSTGGSSLQEVYRVAGTCYNVPSLHVVAPFYEHPAYVRASAAVARPVVADFEPDHVLFSFHGLPERQIRKGDDAGSHCLVSEGCCARITEANRNCYRAQCYASARAIAGALSLSPERYSVSFQSRLGRIPWIQPHTEEMLVRLAEKGVKRLAVVCPAFTADCLETLEEIGIRARATFVSAGGEDLRLVPSLNAHPEWVEAIKELLTPYLTTRQAAPALPSSGS
ncbi:MAG TPA: ferrochelatase [Pantanalinema sp.]